MARQTPDPQVRISRRNRWKVIRTILQIILVLFVLFLAVRALLRHREQQAAREAEPAYISSSECELVQSPVSGGIEPRNTDGTSFIAISYNGLTTSDRMDSSIVTQQAYEEQMAALHASGYVTITQQDVVDYYLYHSTLPEKAMLLIFEDGIYNTAELAQGALEKYGYIATACTYAQNLDDVESKFITTANMKELLNNSYWELGSNGYRLSYINIFDRYGNYFGHLTTDEYVLIHDWLRRDYNHYLMDFLRDENRLRQETVEQMEERIAYDYEQMRDIYSAELGYVPSLYILMHSNTGAFGNDPLVSDQNRKMMTQVFDMNFNRQGSCLNTLDSSIYDLTRLQSRHYFSTNHLLMRIWDDTGDEVAFVVGDAQEAAKWKVSEGVAEFKDGNQIILTTEPYAEGKMLLEDVRVADVDMTVTLQGNIVGRQGLCLRTDESLSSGVEVALENNELVVRDLSAGGAELFRQNLFTLDGGPFKSEQEDEREGLIALQQAIIQWDDDPARVAEAEAELERLNATTAVNLEEGGTPLMPELDTSDRDSRKLRIQLIGTRLSVWLDDKLVAEHIAVSGSGAGSVAFTAGVWKESNRYSQTNLYDDVYDAVFVNTQIADVESSANVYYQYRTDDLLSAGDSAQGVVGRVLNFFIENF